MKKNMLSLISLIVLLCMAVSVQAEWIDRTDPAGSGTATASGENVGAGETADKGFDNNIYTKWLTFTAAGWIQYEFADDKGYAISKYTITSANDAPERDPKDWELLGSYDGVNFKVVDSRTGQSWENRFQEKEFTCDNKVAYPIYRLNIIAIQSSDRMQLADIDLMEEVTEGEATNPGPANLASEVPTTQSFTWDAGTGATVLEHKVYMSDGTGDPNLYLVATVPASGTSGSYTPATELSRDGFYQWRVDEITAAGANAGKVWAFNTVLSVPSVDASYPEDTTVWPEEIAVLTTVATNPFTGDDSGLSYTWSKNGSPLTTADTKYSGINTDTLSIQVEDPNDGGLFACTVTLTSNGRTSETRTAYVDVKTLVGHWEFEADATDSTDNNSDGVLVGDASIAAGKIGQALDLDGTGDYARIDVKYPQNDRITITAWVLARTAPTWASIAKNWPGQFHFGLYENQGRLDFEAGPSTGPSVRVNEADAFPLNKWQFVAGVADGKKIRLYRNGVEVGTAVNYDGTLNDTNQVLAIGCKLDGETPSSYWDGLIDDVRIYNAALNANDIADLYIAVEGGSVCISKPAYDLDGDCIVSLNDFALFASSWLQCNLAPASSCN